MGKAGVWRQKAVLVLNSVVLGAGVCWPVPVLTALCACGTYRKGKPCYYYPIQTR